MKTVFYPPMLPDIIGGLPGRQIIEVQAGDLVTCLFLQLCIGLQHLVFNPNKALHHRPSLGNGIGKIALCREDFIATFSVSSRISSTHFLAIDGNVQAR